MESKAILRFARVSARKARLVADLVRGRGVPEAMDVLQFTDKKTAPLVRKLIESAVANAEDHARRDARDLDIDTLYVKTITVDGGPALRRFRPRAQGRATKILKKTSHLSVELAVR
ncbi:MAG: 50S ribosomal protein L22 [Deltaproteobacteria bacterium]|nr:50S ribosomal protein L22 [Deltaproteobacteria bacterium]